MQLPIPPAIRNVGTGTPLRPRAAPGSLVAQRRNIEVLPNVREEIILRNYRIRLPLGVIPASSIRRSAIPPGRHCGDVRRYARLLSSLETQKFFQMLRKKSILRNYLMRRPRGVMPASSIRRSAIPPGRHCGDGRRHAFCKRAGSAGMARWRSSGSVNSESRSVS